MDCAASGHAYPAGSRIDLVRVHVVLLTPQGSPLKRDLCSVCHAHPCRHTGHAPEYQEEKVLEDFDVFLRGSRGQRGDPSGGFYGKFAGILQGEIRQRVSSVRMLMILIV
jgi:hypothetical protein